MRCATRRGAARRGAARHGAGCAERVVPGEAFVPISQGGAGLCCKITNLCKKR